MRGNEQSSSALAAPFAMAAVGPPITTQIV